MPSGGEPRPRGTAMGTRQLWTGSRQVGGLWMRTPGRQAGEWERQHKRHAAQPPPRTMGFAFSMG